MRCVYLICLLSLSVFCTAAEPILKSLAAAPTQLRYTLNDAPLAVLNQAVSSRAVTEERKQSSAQHGPDISLVGYQAYHLELVFKLKSIDKRKLTKAEFYFGNEVVHSIDLIKEGRLMTLSAGARYDLNAIAINLRGTPLALLDSVERINLVKE